MIKMSFFLCVLGVACHAQLITREERKTAGASENDKIAKVGEGGRAKHVSPSRRCRCKSFGFHAKAVTVHIFGRYCRIAFTLCMRLRAGILLVLG